MVWLFIFLFAVFAPILITGIVKRDRELSTPYDDVANAAPSRLEYVYQVNMSCQALCAALDTPNLYDALAYRFDPETAIITFYPYGFSGRRCMPYRLTLEEGPDGTILRVTGLSRASELRNGRQVHNNFWYSKLNAVPFSYVDASH